MNPKTISGFQIWTVARFPNGEWTTGGKTTDPDYADCEVFQVRAVGRKSAKRYAQGERRRKSYEPTYGRDTKDP